MSISRIIEKIRDPRRDQGKRISLEQMISLIIISGLCGHFGGRGVARFARNYSKTFKELLKLKHKEPSHVTISEFLNALDSSELIAAFNEWTEGYLAQEEEEEISLDGKALRSTISNYSKSTQKFQAIVSVFSQKSGLVYALEQYNNGKESEINVVRFLISQLKNRGLVIHLDALHAQKKQLTAL